jgi:hypothetical protein
LYSQLHKIRCFSKALLKTTDLRVLGITHLYKYERVKINAIPVPGRGGPWGCVTSKISHFLDNRLIDGGVVVSFALGSPFTPKEDSHTHFS